MGQYHWLILPHFFLILALAPHSIHKEVCGSPLMNQEENRRPLLLGNIGSEPDEVPYFCTMSDGSRITMLLAIRSFTPLSTSISTVSSLTSFTVP